MNNKIKICVGVVIINNKDEILIIKRKNSPNKGQWSIPGGNVKLGETLKAAAKREIYEETQLIISDLIFLDTVDLIENDISGKTVNHYVLIDFKTNKFSGKPIAGSDAEAALWVKKNEIKEYIKWTETIRVISKAFED